MRRHQIVIDFDSPKSDDDLVKIMSDILDRYFFDADVKHLKIIHQELAGKNGTS